MVRQRSVSFCQKGGMQALVRMRDSARRPLLYGRHTMPDSCPKVEQKERENRTASRMRPFRRGRRKAARVTTGAQE